MQVFNRFLINPEKFRVPQYNISPFSSEWVKRNYRILQSQVPVDRDLLHEYFGQYVLFENGRAALYEALTSYNLSPDDEVYIVTPSGNRYVSSCVLETIEKICQWNRQLSDKTRIVLVVHEFGTVYPVMNEILKLNLPVIEDMAMSMLSTDVNCQTGQYGDFTVYSMSKFFPVQCGGILRVNKPGYSPKSFRTRPQTGEYLEKLLNFYIREVSQIKQKRKYNHERFQSILSEWGFESRFCYTENETPAAYMCSVPSESESNLEKLKVFLQQNGLEASVFYGENAFFVPVHQNLEEEDILFITSLIKFFYETGMIH